MQLSRGHMRWKTCLEIDSMTDEINALRLCLSNSPPAYLCLSVCECLSDNN